MVETQAPDDLLIRFWWGLARPSGGVETEGAPCGSVIAMGLRRSGG